MHYETPELKQLRKRIEVHRKALLDHPVYAHVRDPKGLRMFMEHHVFAVWDFMSLLKALQSKLCGVRVPWIPPANAHASRFINEIVLGEESDADGEGGFVSHFELYHAAMKQCGANTADIDKFWDAIGRGEPVPVALRTADAAESVRQFVTTTFKIIESNDIHALASAFTFGREDLLADVFRKIVEEVNSEADGQLSRFRYYLDRHIQLDEEEHGPIAMRLVADLCGTDKARWKVAEEAAVIALQARVDLWDRVAEKLTTQP